MKNEFDYLNDVKVDFSKYNVSELTEREYVDMKEVLSGNNSKKRLMKKGVVVAVCIASLAAVSQTAFAKEFILNIIKTFTTGESEFVQVEPMSVPDSLKGRVFDKNGNPIEKLMGNEIYDENGNRVSVTFEETDENGNPVYSLEPFDYSVKNEIPESDEAGVVFTDFEKAKSLLSFTPKTPQNLSDGYSFFYAVVPYSPLKGKENEMSDNYITLAYSNGDNLFKISESVGFSYKISFSDEMNEASVNGHSAVYTKNHINWEADGITFSIIFFEDMPKEKLIEIAESLK